MSAPVVLVHLADQHQSNRRLCDGGWLRLIPDDLSPELARKACPRCEARKRELAASAAPAPERELHPLVARLEGAMGREVAEMAQAYTDAAVLGAGWIRITMAGGGPEIQRVDPARIIVVEP